MGCEQFTNGNPDSTYTQPSPDGTTGGGCLAVRCSAPDLAAGTQLVTVDLSACAYAAFAWACCRDGRCQVQNCGGSQLLGNYWTCGNVSSFTFRVPFTMATMPLQVRTSAYLGPSA